MKNELTAEMHFDVNVFAQRPVLTQRLRASLKWPIALLSNCSSISMAYADIFFQKNRNFSQHIQY